MDFEGHAARRDSSENWMKGTTFDKKLCPFGLVIYYTGYFNFIGEPHYLKIIKTVSFHILVFVQKVAFTGCSKEFQIPQKISSNPRENS